MLLVQGTPSFASATSSPTSRTSTPRTRIHAHFQRGGSSSSMSRMAKFCSRLLGPRRRIWNTHEGLLLTTSILKQSRHRQVWRRRFATLTPEGIWTFKDENQRKISDYFDFQEIVSVEH